MLQLNEIKKTYGEKEAAVEALKGVSLSFRRAEFVSVLGPSGCGKTTLLNIIGGLDRYTSGDLSINGVSTKDYRDRDWDTYRNHTVGFVFQSYNLIPHQTVLENVELTLTLCGIPAAERKRRAKEALKAVGLEEKINKKPSELSGGQMQRVSIARALVGNPEIVLADEPTGALDSETSETVMQILKEISKTKLVIMVTHNPDLAERYSDRIVKMLDGRVVEDTNPYEGESTFSQEKKGKNSAMSFLTALYLSGKNLLSKKRRTTITSFAASIGLIGIAVILSISNGMSAYIESSMLDNASLQQVILRSTTTVYEQGEETPAVKFPEGTTGVTPYEAQTVKNKRQDLSAISEYLKEEAEELTLDIALSYGMQMPILYRDGETYLPIPSDSWSECLGNAAYLAEKYTVLAGEGFPQEKGEISLVVDEYNRLPAATLTSLGFFAENGEIAYSEIVGREYRVIANDDWYVEENGIFRTKGTTESQSAYERGISVKIKSVLRATSEDISYLSEGIVYSKQLTEFLLEQNGASKVYLAQLENKETDVTTGMPFGNGSMDVGTDYGGGMPSFSTTHEDKLASLGAPSPSCIVLYPLDVNAKEEIVGLIDRWNETHEPIGYLDLSNAVSAALGSLVNIVTYVLVAFSVLSLVISSIMIAIIIYASVIERTKEIGVLRSVGARKKDISRVFRAEAVILGGLSGGVAVLVSCLLNGTINLLIGKMVGVSSIATLSPLTALFLVALSIVLLLIASLIPAKIASKKQPAIALRTE